MGNATRCPICNRFGNKDLGGYCKACYPKRPKEEPIELCTRCGLRQATRVNDEYEGCVPYPLCDECYMDRFGHLPESDFEKGKEPACVQCGEPAFKMADNGYPYCLRHFRDRTMQPIDPAREHFKEDYDMGGHPFWTDEFEIVKDNFDMEDR